jgi:hypothetical protein
MGVSGGYAGPGVQSDRHEQRDRFPRALVTKNQKFERNEHAAHPNVNTLERARFIVRMKRLDAS